MGEIPSSEAQQSDDEEEEETSSEDDDNIPLDVLAEREHYRRNNHYVDELATGPPHQYTATDLAQLYDKPQYVLEHAECMSTPF